MSDVPDSRPDWMSDPSLAGGQFGDPNVNQAEIAAQVAQAMSSLGKRASFDGLSNDQMGRQVFDPTSDNAAAQLANQQGIQPAQPAPGVPTTPPPPDPPPAQPPQTSPQQPAIPDPADTPAPEGVDQAAWEAWLAQQPPAQSDTSGPVTPPAPDPAQPAQQPAPEPAAEVPNSLKVNIQGQEYEITGEQATYLLQVNSWLEQQPAEVKDAWSRIQRGEAVAMDRAEYDQIVAAQQAANRILQFQQQNPQTQQQQLIKEPDMELLDDETAAYIQHLKSQVPQGQTSPYPQVTADLPPQPGQQQPPQQQPAFDQQQMYQIAQQQAQRDTANRSILETAVNGYKEQYDLDDAQVDRLTRVVAESRMVPVLMQKYAVHSPLGDLVSEAPFDRVVNEAFSMAMATDAELSQVHNDYIFNQRLAAQQGANQRVNDKKSRAGSLAAAPSAAVPAGQTGLPPIGPGNQMNLPAMTAAIAQAITEAEAAG